MIENLIVSFSGLIGFLTVILILLRYKSNRITNIYLVIIFIIISTRMLLVGTMNIGNIPFILSLLTKYNNLSIIIVPCSYLYFYNLIKDQKRIKFENIVHFIIPMLFSIFEYLIDQKIFNIIKPKYSVYIFFSIYAIIYYIFMFRLLNANVWNRKGEIGIVVKQNQLIKKWSIYLFSFFVITAIRLITVLLWEINNDTSTFGTSYLWISAIFWLIVYFKIIISPEILYGYSYLNTKLNEQKKNHNLIISFWTNSPVSTISNLQDIQLKEKIKNSIEQYMREIDQFSFHNQAYRNEKFSLTDLANKLNIPKSHLTYLFKYHSKISFPEYKKIVRIYDGLELIDSGYLTTNTYDSLAKEIGFTSYNTFFVSFKDVTGVSPQEFLVKTMKNKLYA